MLLVIQHKLMVLAQASHLLSHGLHKRLSGANLLFIYPVQAPTIPQLLHWTQPIGSRRQPLLWTHTLVLAAVARELGTGSTIRIFAMIAPTRQTESTSALASYMHGLAFAFELSFHAHACVVHWAQSVLQLLASNIAWDKRVEVRFADPLLVFLLHLQFATLKHGVKTLSAPVDDISALVLALALDDILDIA